ncbi:NAD(P)/FAD-dependent oxidoreductase [Streptomyces sp. NPDC005438]|uniref:flavin-containing monooxygenase n=1 Tax=Streptomyces sp. NPDC005438 TaxID=3156880 RepID=UPI0033B35D9F
MPDARSENHATPVHVIGAGPAGLAAAAALKDQGIRSVVLDRSPSVGSSWRAHYDHLRLHTTRGRSALPGLPIPRSHGRWVSRDDMVRYLEDYASHHHLEVAPGVSVDRVEREDDRWVLHANGGRRLSSPVVVVATGFHHTPRMPDLPGRDGYLGELLHSRDYREPGPYRGRDVLVIGAGNSGTEIATDLARGGAQRVRLAVRGTPHLVRRSFLGWPAQNNAILSRRLPTGLADRLAHQYTRLTTPDLAPQGLPRPQTGLVTRARQGALPVYDSGLIKAVRKGTVEPVRAVESFDGDKVVLAGGERIAPEVVIAATGYEQALEKLVGHLSVLDESGRPLVNGRRSLAGTPGLYFLGYTNPASGALRELALDARKIARAVARTTS